MTITLKRQLADDEKRLILERHGRICFATGHAIPEGEPIQFDHIRAFAKHGESELNNIAPMCEVHNKEKGTLPLGDFRVKLRLKDFFAIGGAPTLKHLLKYLRERGDIQRYGQSIAIHETNDRVKIESPWGTNNHDLYQCPTTGWKYFYATLPIDVLDSDDDDELKIGLQPRSLINDKVFNLYRHFQRHPVLQPSIGRIHNNHIVLFDGQHKIAGLLLTGRRHFECKIYLSPELRLLNETNISAHDMFSQVRFYSPDMIRILGKTFGTDFEAYKNLEDGLIKSEAGFMKYLENGPRQTTTAGERNKQFKSFLYLSIRDHEHNLARPLFSTGNKSTDKCPLTIDMLSKSIFNQFIYKLPTEDNIATDAYKRDKEIANNVALLNMFYDLALSQWNHNAGSNDETQRRLIRLFRSKSIIAWSQLLHSAICGVLDLHDDEERMRPFYRDLNPQDIDRTKGAVKRLIDWKFWDSPPNSEIDHILADNNSAIKEWFKNHGLTTGFLMGARE
jgi:hypothetical protein